jgi:D-arabinose 1-dehydrogenase-like Zn-dependent alcohol dehydrogenase
VQTEVEAFPLEAANEALDRLRAGAIRGAAVISVSRLAEPDSRVEPA